MQKINKVVHGYGEIKKFSIEHNIGYRRLSRMLKEGNYYIHDGGIFKRVAKLNESDRSKTP